MTLERRTSETTRTTESGRRSSEDIHRDITHTRQEMDRTIDEIGARLSPRRLVDQIVDRFGPGETPERRAGVGAGSGISDSIRPRAPRHTWSSAVVGTAAWWWARRRRADAGHGRKLDALNNDAEDDVRRQATPVTSRIADAADTVEDTMKDATSKTQEYVRDGAARAKEQIAESIEGAQRTLNDGQRIARRRGRAAVEEYPLAVGAACFGVGLLAGLAFPRTQYEDDLIGDVSDEVTRKAKRVAEEAVVRGQQVAVDTAEAAMAEAERKGLTPRQLEESLRDTARAVKSSVEEVTGDVLGSAEAVVAGAGDVATRAAKTAKAKATSQAGVLAESNQLAALALEGSGRDGFFDTSRPLRPSPSNLGGAPSGAADEMPRQIGAVGADSRQHPRGRTPAMWQISTYAWWSGLDAGCRRAATPKARPVFAMARGLLLSWTETVATRS